MTTTGRRIPFNNLTQAERWELVKSVEKLCYKTAYQFCRTRLADKEDFIQEAFAGAWYAATAFDPDRGVEFITYATPWIREYCKTCDPGFGISPKMYIFAKKLAKRTGNEAHMPKFMHVSEYTSNEFDGSIIHTLTACEHDGFDAVERKDEIEQILSMIKQHRRRGIFRMLLTGLNYRQIAQKMGVTWQRVKQIVDEEMKRIKTRLGA